MEEPGGFGTVTEVVTWSWGVGFAGVMAETRLPKKRIRGAELSEPVRHSWIPLPWNCPSRTYLSVDSGRSYPHRSLYGRESHCEHP